MTAVAPPLAGLLDGSTATVAGTIVDWQRRITRQGRPWVSGRLDADGAVTPFEIFPTVYEQIGHFMREGDQVTLTGRVDKRHDVPLLQVAGVER